MSETDLINLRYQDGSVGSPSKPEKFNNQDFGQLKQSYIRRGRLFVDNTFPPVSQSLGDVSQKSTVKWRRPSDILKAQNVKEEPSFVVDSATRFDFGQGKLNNCWFLASIASLTFKKDLMVQVVPTEQDFEDYAGIFHFRFWRFGKWVDVVIDDYLPTHFQYGSWALLSVSAKTRNEFWAPLLEKAYAKVCGSYSDMNAGIPSEALKDFSGGVHMMYKLKEIQDRNHYEVLWVQLTRATKCKSMICTGTYPEDTLQAGNGLVVEHAYSVTAVTEVFDGSSNVRLVRVMNPWGFEEWNGKWSDKSSCWDRISDEDKAKCVKRDDGEFWMELEDFCQHFLMVTICSENPNFIDGDVHAEWKVMIYDGEWVAGRTAGGNSSNSTFSTNPQFRITVTEIDEDEKEDKNVLLSLMQVPSQGHRNDERLRAIGITVFALPEGTPAGRVGNSFFSRNEPLKITAYSYKRDLIEQHSLKPGEYVVVPSIMEAYAPGKFVLSVYTKTETSIEPYLEGEDDYDDHLILPTPLKPVVPAEKTTVYDMFKSYADQNGELNASQLQKLLNETIAKGSSDVFDRFACRSMIAAVDDDRMGKMTFKEFSTLWDKFEEFKKIFNRSNVSLTGTLTYDELIGAVQAADIELDSSQVWLEYTSLEGDSMSLVDFLTLMLRIDNMTKKFKDKASDGIITMDWKDFSHNFMYT